MVDFKLGVDNCFAAKRWPETEDWVKIVKEYFKIDVVEYDSDFLDPLFTSEKNYCRISSDIKNITQKNDLLIHNYFTGEMTHCVNFLSDPDKGIREDSTVWVEKAIKIATMIGAKGIGGHFDTIPLKAYQSSKTYNYYIDALIDKMIYFSEIAYNEGHKILMLEQMYSPLEVPYTIKQTYEILEKINSKSKIVVSPVLDLGHTCCQDFEHSAEDLDPYIWLKEFSSVVEVVHLQQTNGIKSCHWPFTEKYNNKGIIKPEKVLKALEKSSKNEIFLILEIFFSMNQDDNQILQEMAETIDYWKKYVSN